MQTRVIRVDAGGEFARQIAPAVRAIRAGRIVGFPTETVYGIGVVATSPGAVRRLRRLKDRPKGAFAVHLSAPEEAARYVQDVPFRAATLMRKAWPGPVALLLPTGGRFADPALVGEALFHRICQDGVVGLRCPSDPVARLLLRRARRPVLATSANLAGRADPRTAEDVLSQLDGRIDVLIDAGPTRYGQASSVVAFDGQDYRIVRAGVHDARTIERLSSRTVLFVCTGNTCRSPMAAALARRLLAERIGCEPAVLERFGQEVLSAGTAPARGAPASKEAVEAARRMGAALDDHRARGLTNDLIRSADVIFCIARRHLADVTDRVPDAAGKTFLLDAQGDIADPIGGGADAYARAAGRIERSLRKRMKEDLL